MSHGSYAGAAEQLQAVRALELSGTVPIGADTAWMLGACLLQGADPQGFVVDLPLAPELIWRRVLASEVGDTLLVELRHRYLPGLLSANLAVAGAAFAAALVLGISLGSAMRRSSNCPRCCVRLCPRCDPEFHGGEICEGCAQLFYRPDAFRSEQREGPTPTLLLQTGYDGTLEELHSQALAANRRGWSCLTFEGPGQGRVIREQGLPFRHDWEHVVTPVVDVALARRDVDPDRIALQGLSLGGYLAPRAAAFEHRLAACIANGGVFDFMGSRVPAPMTREQFQAMVENAPDAFDAGVKQGMVFRVITSTTPKTIRKAGTATQST